MNFEQVIEQKIDERIGLSLQTIRDLLKPIIKEAINELMESTPEPSPTNAGIYYTTQEVSELLGGIKAKALIEKRKNKGFPDPVSKNGSGNLYLKKDVNNWMEKKGLQ